MGRVPLKNAYTVVYERAGTELARYSLTAFNGDDARGRCRPASCSVRAPWLDC